MLTKDKITANEALTGLSEDQITAIETLSRNDEQAVIDKRIGEIYGQIDNDIKEVTGEEKPSGIKTYQFVKQTLTNYKEKAAQTNQEEVTRLKTQISELNKKIKDGSTDEKLKADLDQAKTDLKAVQDKYESDKQKWQNDLQQKDKEMSTFKVKSALERSASALKFKPSDIIPEDVRSLAVRNSIDSILEKYNAVEVEGKIQFRDKTTGETLRDENDSMNPMTPEKLLSGNLKSVLDEGTPGGGGGGKPPAGPPTPATTIKNARTQIEADQVIEKDLAARGLAKGTDEYQTEFDKVRTENNVSKLPMK